MLPIARLRCAPKSTPESTPCEPNNTNNDKKKKKSNMVIITTIVIMVIIISYVYI